MRLYLTDITSMDEAKRAIDWGASSIGIRIGYGKGTVPAEKAREIFVSIPVFISRTGIFTDEKRYHIQELVTFCRLDTLHFIGAEKPEDIEDYNEHKLKTFSYQESIAAENYPLDGVIIEIKSGDDLSRLHEYNNKMIILTGQLTAEEWRAVLKNYHPYALALPIKDVNESLIDEFKKM